MSCKLADVCLRPTTSEAFQTLFSAFQYMIASQCLVTDYWEPSADVKDREYFHFIIVGAGTAGCVVANRLTENKKWNVLLIEAGGDPPIESYLPQFFSNLQSTQYDWQYTTVPTLRTNQANVGEIVNWPRGKLLGGSAAINAMVYFQGHEYDYQNWFDVGNPEWHPDIVRKFNKKAESLQDQDLLQDPHIKDTYGSKGPQVINSFNITYREITEKVLESYNEMGYKTQKDLQTAKLLGSGRNRATVYNGRRASTATSYLSNIKGRKNLKILKNAFVTKLLINNSSEAYGVEVDHNNKKLKIFASLEVILSAGVVNSPQLLMLSGIGPKKHLESKNVTCKVDLPAVGQNLQDHFTIPVPIFAKEPGYEDEGQTYLDVALYSFNRTGYLAQSSMSDILVLYSRDKNATYPEFQSHLLISSKNATKGINYFLKYKKPIFDYFSKLLENHGLFLFKYNLLHPYSRGNISLKNNNPYDHPLIYANYFDDSRDLEAASQGIRMLTKIIDTKYFRSIDGFLGRYNWSKCNSYKLNSISYWKCICPEIVLTIYHPVGTCTMGPNPKLAVVDSRLRVHHVKRLRVIDASIMPNITSCNTNGPTIMIGERGSELIKEDHGVKLKLTMT